MHPIVSVAVLFRTLEAIWDDDDDDDVTALFRLIGLLAGRGSGRNIGLRRITSIARDLAGSQYAIGHIAAAPSGLGVEQPSVNTIAAMDRRSLAATTSAVFRPLSRRSARRPICCHLAIRAVLLPPQSSARRCQEDHCPVI